jgi:two-component system, cell cycle response regulator DivK
VVMATLVLIVDDSDLNRKLARDVLQASGLDTLEAASGEEAIALARAHRPDVVVMDLRLPDLDGAEALRRLKDDPATGEIPVVAVTALTGARAALIEAGFAGYIEKPIDALAFPQQIQSFTRGRDAGTPPGREGSTLDGSRPA